jgi:hypothetical protein
MLGFAIKEALDGQTPAQFRINDFLVLFSFLSFFQRSIF